jgi:selenocysteine-specific elongation factor
VHVIATAGHVDHGKSSLVLALTGTDPDRWAEEKARGLTIDLGFASTTLPSGAAVSFVDVPGHVRFLKNMLAGVGAVDACLFVVAATEAWKPQSEEHLRILDLLGQRHGLVALTKAALVDEDHLELARLEVADRVAGSFLEHAEVVAVDALNGTGLDELRAALDRLVADTPTAADRGRPRLWIDRAFAARGAGTVVTGTLTGGALDVDDELWLAPQRRAVRVRSLQSHHDTRPRVGPGNRVAVNLVGVTHDEVARGDVLVRPGQWHETAILDASLTVLPSVDHTVSRRGAWVAYLGSREVPVRLRVLGPAALEPAQTGAVRLHLPVPLPLLPGDHFVLREAGRGETVGGGEVLDVAPVRAASRARPDRSVERVVAERGWVDADELERLTGARLDPTVGSWVVDPVVAGAAREELSRRVAEAGPLGLDLATLDGRQRALLDSLEGVEIDAGRAVPATGRDPLEDHPYPAALAAALFAPPPPEGVDRGELRELVRRGRVVEEAGICFAPEAVEAAARIVAGLLEERPDGVTVAEIREALGTTRKYALPLLAVLDATGRTRRRGDLRIAGPRLGG